MKYQKIDVWDNNKYIGTITYYSYSKKFTFNISGVIESINFKNSKHLEKMLDRHIAMDVHIPLEVKEKIDMIAIINEMSN